MAKSIVSPDELQSVIEWLVKLKQECTKLTAHAESMAQDLGGDVDELASIARRKTQIFDLIDRATDTVCTWQLIQAALNPMGRPPKVLDTLKERVIEYQTIIELCEKEALNERRS